MGTPKKDNPKRAVAGCVEQWAKDRLTDEAKRQQMTVGAYVGRLLEEYARGLPSADPDPNQLQLPIIKVQHTEYSCGSAYCDDPDCVTHNPKYPSR